MSWKIIVSAGLLCVLASPVLAAPSVSVTNGGLNAAGNWIWNVQISNTNPVPTGSSPLAAELGFQESVSSLISAAALNPATNFDTPDPGTAIYGWETAGVNSNGKPVGIETNCASGCTVNVPGTSPNSVFSALGSVPFSTVGPHDYIQIITKGPTATSSSSNAALRTSTLAMSGAYSGNGRVAELTGAATSANYDTFTGSFSRTATPGDTNLTGGVNLTDFNTVLSGIGIGTTWSQGNFHGNGTGTVNLTDFNTVLSSIGLPSGGAGAGLGAGGAVPEPATVTLMVLGLVGLLAMGRRK
jgi:hypothetical protein